jgi:membrane-associated protease RseP (regulator of RpoE activity)
MGTVLFAGLGDLQSPDIPRAVMFMGAIMAILGSHEMGHKLLADKHEVEATYPYFIPGPPPIGTFGAVIQQKSLPPNRDALFDIGFTGPIMGFIVTAIIMVIGTPMCTLKYVKEVPAGTLPTMLLFEFFIRIFLNPSPPPPGEHLLIMLHPVAFAAWVGMLVTMLNLVPTGMFDGGHVARSLVGRKAHQILSYLGIILLLIIWYPMAIIALFFSMYRHPGPLDDISKVTTRRKLSALGLIAIFVLCVPYPPISLL